MVFLTLPNDDGTSTMGVARPSTAPGAPSSAEFVSDAVPPQPLTDPGAAGHGGASVLSIQTARPATTSVQVPATGKRMLWGTAQQTGAPPASGGNDRWGALFKPSDGGDSALPALTPRSAGVNMQRLRGAISTVKKKKRTRRDAAEKAIRGIAYNSLVNGQLCRNGLVSHPTLSSQLPSVAPASARATVHGPGRREVKAPVSADVVAAAGAFDARHKGCARVPSTPYPLPIRALAACARSLSVRTHTPPE